MKGLLFTYALTYGGALAGLFRPFIGLLVYVCFAILRPEFVWYWSVPQGNYSRILATALLTGWVLRGCGSWVIGRGSGVIACLIGYMTIAVIGATRAPDQPAAWAFVSDQFKIVLIVLVGISTIDSVAKLRQLAWVIMLSQAYVAFELNLTYLGGYNLLKEEGFGGMDNNSYTISLVTCTGLAFFLGLHSDELWKRVIAVVSGLLMTHAVLFSFSRGGMMSLIVTSVAAFLVIPKKLSHCIYGVVLVAAALCLTGSEVRQRFMSSFAESEKLDSSAQSRLDLWAACWDTMLKHPISGVGPNHMPLVIDQYGFRQGKEAHTTWLQIGAELGFPGVICLFSYYALCVARLWPLARGRQAVTDPWLTYLARMVIASLCGFLVSAQFVTSENLEAPYYVALVGAGVLKLHDIRTLTLQTHRLHLQGNAFQESRCPQSE
jgi:probable O-glycosylation ligase (exosortase A-associated)